jgi:hypothetical protein
MMAAADDTHGDGRAHTERAAEVRRARCEVQKVLGRDGTGLGTGVGSFVIVIIL